MTVSLEPPVGSRIERLCGISTPPGATVLACSRSISEAVATLGSSIRPWIDEDPERPAVLVVLLEGGRFFGDRLVAQLRESCSADFTRMDLKVSTRDGDGRPLESPRIQGNVEALEGRRILLVDDILDTGLTLRLTQECLSPLTAELRSAVLIQKDDPRGHPMDPARPSADFVGMEFTDDRWFSGAGMDMPGDSEGLARNSSFLIAYPTSIFLMVLS